MKKLMITKENARKYIVYYQGLGGICEEQDVENPSQNEGYQFYGKEGIIDYIKRVGCIQYDSLNIVGRNSELVLQSRIPQYNPDMLDELLYIDRKLVDGLDKEMSVYLIEDWPYFKRHRDTAFERYAKEGSPYIPFISEARKELKNRGPLSSIDLNMKEIVDWSCAPTRASRAALESMYLYGELIIHHKVNTRKVYDFACNHLPKELLKTEEPNRTKDKYYEWHVLRRIGAIGLLWNKASDAWLRIPGLKSNERNIAIDGLLKKKKITEIEVEGISYPFYIRSSNLPLMEKVINDKDFVPRTSIIAPLDNMMWDRKLIGELFSFDYRWEVYKPAEERKYGYYVLPVLYGDRFIARFEPGKDRETGALVIKNWWWEPEIAQDNSMNLSIKRCFKSFLDYLGTDKLIIDEKAVKQIRLELIV